MSKDAYRLAPAASVIPLGFEISLWPPFERRMSYEITFGCAGSSVRRVAAEISGDQLKEAIEEFLRSTRDEDSGFGFAKKVIQPDKQHEYYSDDDFSP